MLFEKGSVESTHKVTTSHYLLPHETLPRSGRATRWTNTPVKIFKDPAPHPPIHRRHETDVPLHPLRVHETKSPILPICYVGEELRTRRNHLSDVSLRLGIYWCVDPTHADIQ